MHWFQSGEPGGTRRPTADGKATSGTRIGRVVPNAFFSCIAVVRAAIGELQREIAVMLGEFGGRLHDIRGVVLQDEPTAVDGPIVYRATLSIWPS
ncbi:MAG: hypothetical protein KIS73_24515 [Enhydrobacter sp.]|nr:hypothetical protein [Enhydrobacter sp.]